MTERRRDTEDNARLSNLMALKAVRKRVGQLQIEGDIEAAAQALADKLDRDLVRHDGISMVKWLGLIAGSIPVKERKPAVVTVRYLGNFAENIIKGGAAILLTD